MVTRLLGRGIASELTEVPDLLVLLVLVALSLVLPFVPSYSDLGSATADTVP